MMLSGAYRIRYLMAQAASGCGLLCSRSCVISGSSRNGFGGDDMYRRTVCKSAIPHPAGGWPYSASISCCGTRRPGKGRGSPTGCLSCATGRGACIRGGSASPEADARAAGGSAPHPRKLRPRPRRQVRACSCPSVRFAGRSTCRAVSRTTRTKDSSATTRCAPPDR